MKGEKEKSEQMRETQTNISVASVRSYQKQASRCKVSAKNEGRRQARTSDGSEEGLESLWQLGAAQVAGVHGDKRATGGVRLTVVEWTDRERNSQRK